MFDAVDADCVLCVISYCFRVELARVWSAARLAAVAGRAARAL